MPFYEHGNFPGTRSPGDSAPMRAEFARIALAFRRLARYTGNASKLVIINADGTGYTVLDRADLATFLGVLTVNGGTMQGPLILGRAPVDNLEAATKGFVESQRFSFRSQVTQRLAQLSDNDRLLVSSGGQSYYLTLGQLRAYILA